VQVATDDSDALHLQPEVGLQTCFTFIVCFMPKPNDIKENFSALLRDSLRSRYGRIPSAAVVAREFNLRAYETSPVSQESARRWLRGVSLPEEERLRILVNWLNLDFNKALQMKNRSSLDTHADGGGSSHSRNGGFHGDGRNNGNGGANGSGNSDVRSSGNPAHWPAHNGLDKEAHELIEAMMQMDTAQKLALLDLVRLGFGNSLKNR
jgi:hypothetical protein